MTTVNLTRIDEKIAEVEYNLVILRKARNLILKFITTPTTPPPKQPDEGHNMRTVKRYSNRKLYDTTEKHYVTLPNIAQQIRRGEDVQVTDHVVGTDLTSQTMAQIIFEEEKKNPRIGVETLTKIIRTGIIG